MTNEEAERIAAREESERRPVWFVTGKTLKEMSSCPKMTSDKEAIVDHRMYLLTFKGLWKIE
jgi:hypothetical protein